MWNTDDELVGQRVTAYDSYGEGFLATVLAVSTKTDQIKVRDEEIEPGDILIGNQWEPAD